ncbi:MAG: GNAT family N-acetyltransferase [Sphaerochaetaceae bacterium]|nr:GNAT family N-acetyltransferase [Sphaerochaetaceae bacterium]NLV84904.1 GNAT family N-acetyltransferase [Spirochaetales bacterium]
MNKIMIRSCNLHDLEILRDLSITTFVETFAANNTAADIKQYVAEHFHSSRIKEELENPDSFFYLVECNGKTVAYMKLNIGDAQTESGYPDSLELQRIYVLKAFKRQHIGNLLMDKTIEMCKSKRLAYVWLGVWEHNKDAIRFYERLGFKMYDSHQFILGSDVQRDYIMKLEM